MTRDEEKVETIQKGRVALLNINGLKNEVILKRRKRHMINKNIEILFITEPLGTEDREKEMKKVFAEYDIIFKGRKKKKGKRYLVRGGVACIARKGTARVEKESKEDDVLYVTWNGISIACAYLVPPSSPFASRNEKKIEEIQEHFVPRDRCMLMADANVWIGEIPSTVANTNGVIEGEDTVYERISEKKDITTHGAQFVQKMDSVNMIILNGVKTVAQYTYDHPGQEAKSIIDYIAVSRSVYPVVSQIFYDDIREQIETDHIMLYVDVEKGGEPLTHPADAGPGRSRKEKRREQKQRKAKKNKHSALQKLKQAGVKDPIWKVLEGACERNFQEFTVDNSQTVEQASNNFKNTVVKSAEETIQQSQPIKITMRAKLNTTSNIKYCRKRKAELFDQMRNERDVERRKRIKVTLGRVSNKLKRETKKAISQFKQQQVREIENLEVGNCKRMWKELKKLTKWNNKEEIPDVVVNDRKEEVKGEGVKEVWKEAFRALGLEDTEDKKFDVQFCKETIEQQKQLTIESYEENNVQEELDKELEQRETEDAVIRLKLGKAAGCDQVVAEILKKGGDSIVSALHKLCVKVWEEEKLPDDWTRGIIFPIYKDGDERDPLNYRGITLLSIVGKVYAQILNDRLTRWSENHKVLVEEQGGFRPGRGCPDQLFSIVELLRNRGKRGTYTCFIDVKKAFDRVFRAGLWVRVAEEGVKGKMWRVLVSLYEKVESCVKVKEHFTDWFPVNTGVRQGCILSPLLYALFINGLVKELNALNNGINITATKKLSALLYADDIVLLSDDRYALQEMLDVVTKYARQWRFELNAKKSEVVVFGQRYPPRHVDWTLGGQTIKQVTKYKYLGIELTRTLKWHVYHKRILTKAYRNMTQALGMGIRGGYMRTRLANIMWKSLVRSIIEYGCEVWGEKSFTDFEKLQTCMGKKILRCSSRTNDEVVRGELGWERQRSRFDELRLRYWARILRMGEERIVQQIYKESKERMEKEEKEQQDEKHEEKRAVTDTWCRYTRQLLCELDLGQVWNNQSVPPESEWNKIVRDAIHKREQEVWRAQCLSKSKLRTYCKLKPTLRLEPLLDTNHRGGIPELVKLRGGTNRLRIEKGRYTGEAPEDRLCVFCDMREVESEQHFLLRCKAYAQEREEMWRAYEHITQSNRNDLIDEDAQMRALLGDTHQPSEEAAKDSTQYKLYQNLIKEVMKYTTTAMRKRRRSEEKAVSAMSLRGGAVYSAYHPTAAQRE